MSLNIDINGFNLRPGEWKFICNDVPTPLFQTENKPDLNTNKKYYRQSLIFKTLKVAERLDYKKVIKLESFSTYSYGKKLGYELHIHILAKEQIHSF